MNLSLDGYIEGPGREDGSWVRIDEEAHTRVQDSSVRRRATSSRSGEPTLFRRFKSND